MHDPLSVTPVSTATDDRRERPPRWSRSWLLLLGLASLALLLPRFWQLAAVPDGFYIDEAAIAAQVLCLAQDGTDARGQPYPLYAEVLGGGQASPTLLYPAAGWSQVFGESIAALRSFSVLHGVVVVGLIAGLVGWLSRSGMAVLLTLLVGFSQPWWFTATRVFWDPVMGASWWAVALTLYWWGRHPRLPRASSVSLWTCAGLAAVAAAYAYPPVRVQMLISGVLVLAIDWPWRRVGWWLLLPLLVMLLALLPLLHMYLEGGGFAGRGDMLAIWNAGWMRSQGYQAIDLPLVALKNLGAHLSPEFLFLHGDSNLRHSIGFGGVVGPVGVTLFVLAGALVPGFVRSRESLLLIGLFLAGLMAASLTWEGLPHALRSLGAVGPLLLWSGLAIAALLQSRPPAALKGAVGVLLVVALLAGGRFGIAYFGDYAARSTDWFRGRVPPQFWSSEFGLARLYFEMRDQAQDCAVRE